MRRRKDKRLVPFMNPHQIPKLVHQIQKNNYVYHLTTSYRVIVEIKKNQSVILHEISCKFSKRMMKNKIKSVVFFDNRIIVAKKMK